MQPRYETILNLQIAFYAQIYQYMHVKNWIQQQTKIILKKMEKC